MRRTAAVIGTAIFFVFVPSVVAGVVPWWISHWEFRLSFLGVELTRFVGSALILAGVSGLVDSFGRFALQGLGTPAPIAPTQHLVVTGLYRYVRNPIYVAVAAVIFRQAVLFGDWRLFAYGAVFCLVCHLFVVGYEEPTLRKSFGAEYEAFRINVPRWIPRLTAWRGGR
jgi:protein-S-isoprenylcysteine O-methyltransferase Ste14